MEIECLLFCFTKAMRELPGDQIGVLSGVIEVIFKLP